MIELAKTLERIISKQLANHLIDYRDGCPQNSKMRGGPILKELTYILVWAACMYRRQTIRVFSLKQRSLRWNITCYGIMIL